MAFRLSMLRHDAPSSFAKEGVGPAAVEARDEEVWG
jgi:hypothetical protein